MSTIRLEPGAGGEGGDDALIELLDGLGGGVKDRVWPIFTKENITSMDALEGLDRDSLRSVGVTLGDANRIIKAVGPDGAVVPPPRRHVDGEIAKPPPRKIRRSGMQIFLKGLDGKKSNLEILDFSEPIDSFKERLCEDYKHVWGLIKKWQLRLIFEGQPMQDDRTFSEHGVEEGGVIQCIKQIPGDIGVFGAHHPGTSGTAFLDGSTLIEAAAPAEVAALIASLNGDPAGECQLHSDRVVLGHRERSALIAAADAYHRRDPRPDVKLQLTGDKLAELIGQAAYRRSVQLYRGPVDEILVRRTEATAASEEPMHIRFHTDYNVRTMQVVLNDPKDYDGGRLIFATGKGFRQPRRTAGSATIHSGRLVHGVTALTSGVRYGLFFLQHPDGHGGWQSHQRT